MLLNTMDQHLLQYPLEPTHEQLLCNEPAYWEAGTFTESGRALILQLPLPVHLQCRTCIQGTCVMSTQVMTFSTAQLILIEEGYPWTLPQRYDHTVR
jgi:hypothetical protein